MEIILILFFLVFLAGILFLAFKLCKWILVNKIRAWICLGIVLISSVGLGIHHLFFKHMMLIQSEVYPNLYLAKYYENDENQLHSLIREQIKNHLSHQVPVGKKLAYQKDNLIFFYAYYKAFPISVFQDAGTAYFLENEEDLGGLVTEELGMYHRYKLAELVLSPDYDWVWPFHDGRTLVCNGCVLTPMEDRHKALEGGLWGCINKEGKEVVPVKYKSSDVPRK